MPAGRRVGHLQVHVVDELLHLLGRGDAHERLDSTIEIAVHEVGGTDPHLRFGNRALANLRTVGIRERVDAAVFEEAAENRAHANVIGKPGYAWLE